MLRDIGQIEGALTSFRLALDISPNLAVAHYNLGNVLREVGQIEEAVSSYRRALEISPDYADAHRNMGMAMMEQGCLAAADAGFRRALEIRPDWPDAYDNLLFASNYDPDKTAEEIRALYRSYDERFGIPLRACWYPHANSREVLRRLKVGYVSPDFRRHPMRHFLEPLLSRHDPKEVEVFAYAELAAEDEVTQNYKRHVAHWVPTRGMTDAALADRIRADGIDVLVDLAGHTAHNRLLVFARKPAPVSISWIVGYGHTTGLAAIDYLLADAVMAPPGTEHLFEEKIWRLEPPGYPFRPAEGMGTVSSLPAVARGHVTFGTLTRAVRINHRTIRVWAEILKRVANSRLVIDSRNFRDESMRQNMLEAFAAHGIDSGRLALGFRSPPWDVLRDMDIGLDCFPQNSGTTLFETLYMGVPFVTLADRPSVGRLGSSILTGAGHPEWIAASEEQYVDMAVLLASDLPRLAELRAGLRTEMATGTLMDEVGFARRVESAYMQMFATWAAPQ